MLAWLKQSLGIARQDPAHERWVVIDVETSGFDPASDTLISVGGVAIRADGRVVPADSIEITVRQHAASSKDNILIHGIGVDAQTKGLDPTHAASAFLDYVDSSPIMAFHAPFDRGFLARAVKIYINEPFGNDWLDLADLAHALDPRPRLKSLDEWLLRYGIPVIVRHSAAADAFATALLAARLISQAHAHGAREFRALQSMARNAKWLGR